MQAKWSRQANCEVFDLTKSNSSLKLDTVSAGVVSQAMNKSTECRKFG